MVFSLVCVLLLYLGWIRGRWHPLLAPILGAGFFLGLYLFIILPWNTRRAVRQSGPPGMLTGEFSDEGITLGTGETLPWSLVSRWKLNDRVVLLFAADAFVAIPLRAFADRAAAIALARTKLGPPVG
ncbi:MAG TPA: hypothetical protein VM029_06420 [Opitutaceae bacterium]|nr:hypothetical protein [Opitutaceae bacterium]